MANQTDLLRVLRVLYDRGQRIVYASDVGKLLWPRTPGHNICESVFPMGAIAGRMLKACSAVRKVESSGYEILSDQIGPQLTESRSINLKEHK